MTSHAVDDFCDTRYNDVGGRGLFVNVSPAADAVRTKQRCTITKIGVARLHNGCVAVDTKSPTTATVLNTVPIIVPNQWI